MLWITVRGAADGKTKLLNEWTGEADEHPLCINDRRSISVQARRFKELFCHFYYLLSAPFVINNLTFLSPHQEKTGAFCFPPPHTQLTRLSGYIFS